jgi:hypothetical protein
MQTFPSAGDGGRCIESPLFQIRNEVGFISDNGVRGLREFGKNCVLWETGFVVVLEQNYLDTKPKVEGSYHALFRGLLRRSRRLLKVLTTGDISDFEMALSQTLGASWNL